MQYRYTQTVTVYKTNSDDEITTFYVFIRVHTKHERKSGIIRLGHNHDNNNNIQPFDILMALVQIRVPRSDQFQ